MAPFVSKLKEKWQSLGALQKRLVTASVMAPVFLGTIFIGGFLFSLVLIVAAILGYREWLNLVQTERPKSIEYTAYATLALGILLCDFTTLKLSLVFLFFGFVAVAALAHLYMDVGDRRAPPWISLGIFYLGVPCVCILWLRQEGEHVSTYKDWAPVIVLFASVWATDSCAYFSGRKFGGPKLAPTVSPNKTWSGLAGGAVGSAVVTGFLAWAFNFDYWGVYFVYGLVLAVVAQMGDLFESHVKRRAGVKDSGTLIPGHGGLLDRIDGLLTAAPCFALMVTPFL